MIDLSEILTLAKIEGDNKNKVLILGEINLELAGILSQQAGIQLNNYKFSIDVYAIKHIIKNHGDINIEEPKGQVAVTDIDFSLIPDILENPDLVFYDGKNKLGKDVFQFQKIIGDKYVVIKEVRTGKKQLTLNSMRIIKKNHHH
jgi:putative DNA methylase